MSLRGYEAIANCTGRICKVRDCFFTALAVHRNDMAGVRPSHCPISVTVSDSPTTATATKTTSRFILTKGYQNDI